MNHQLGRGVAALFCFALLAGACAGDDDSASGQDSSDTGAGGEVEGTSGNEASVAGEQQSNDTTPTHGGRLVYAIESDSQNPWTHYATSCAISCRMVLRAITDPLFITDDKGEIQPYLVDKVVPNNDYTQWTLTIKDGISFHDGTPLDGAAVKYNIDACRYSPLTGPAFIGLESIEATGQTVTLKYGHSEAVGPQMLRAETCGMMLSPTWMATLSNNPMNNVPFVSEEEFAAQSFDGDPAAPVGVGPFKFVSYTPGSGNSFVAERNEDYWRGEGPNSLTGEGLPYLDEIELVAVPSVQSRSEGLKSGDFDVIHTSDGKEVAKFRANDQFTIVQSSDFAETSHILLNVASGENPTLAAVREVETVDMDPDRANANSPLIQRSCRIALAHAIDRQRIADERYAGLALPANGPFAPGTMGYVEDTGYPSFNLDLAIDKWQECKTDHGVAPVTFALNTTNDGFNLQTADLVASMWTDAFGDEIEVAVTPIQQVEYAGLALAGLYQAQLWRNHGGVDPSEQWYWWSSITASPIAPTVPELGLNFGRFIDQDIDDALATIRHDPNSGARRAAAEQINRAFGENVWNLWTVWTQWGVVATSNVRDIADMEIPDHGPAQPLISGKHHLAQIWCVDGSC